MIPNEIDFSKINSLDEFLQLTQDTGAITKSVTNNLYGLNHQNVKGVLPENRDSYGMAFFTRPLLNLKSANIRNIRKMYSLLTTNPLTVQSYVRNMLDPILAESTRGTPLVDNKMIFIPILTNTIKTMSGWPDIVLPTHTSAAGVRKEQQSIGDGTTDMYQSFDIDCTFKNVKDEPITLLIQTWIHYISMVKEGLLSPHMAMITENEIDYNTRIYRLVLDESKRYVKKIAATGASFPVNLPAGKAFDLNTDMKYNDQTKEINIRFKCDGAMYNDDILMFEFNKAVMIANPEVALMLRGKQHALEKIPYDLLALFNNRGYPVINNKTFELEWWVNKYSLTYKNIMNKLKGV